jgi:hypothetical protein
MPTCGELPPSLGREPCDRQVLFRATTPFDYAPDIWNAAGDRPSIRLYVVDARGRRIYPCLGRANYRGLYIRTIGVVFFVLLQRLCYKL